MNDEESIWQLTQEEFDLTLEEAVHSNEFSKVLHYVYNGKQYKTIHSIVRASGYTEYEVVSKIREGQITRVRQPDYAIREWE